ncbi:MAG: hypothetical protein ACM3ML_17985 [Micromonosporaceae bacterium]
MSVCAAPSRRHRQSGPAAACRRRAICPAPGDNGPDSWRAAFSPLRWGKRIRGLRIDLAAVDGERLEQLIGESWCRRMPKRLLAERR